MMIKFKNNYLSLNQMIMYVPLLWDITFENNYIS